MYLYDEFDEKKVFIVGMFILSVCAFLFITHYWYIIKWLLLALLFLSIIGIGFFIRSMFKSDLYDEPIYSAENTAEYKPSKSDYMVDIITDFIPSFRWHNESGYHAELFRYLLHNDYTQSRVEYQTGSSRPDIIYGDIAIEVKGSTKDNDISTLPEKCLKYSNYYDRLIFVLFDPQYTRIRHTNEIFKGMLSNFDNVVILIKPVNGDYIIYNDPDDIEI